MVTVAAVATQNEQIGVLAENVVDGGLPTTVSLGLNTVSQEEQARERGVKATETKGCYCQECYLAVADLLSVARHGDFHSALCADREKHAAALRRMADAPDAPAHRRTLRGYRFLWLNG